MILIFKIFFHKKYFLERKGGAKYTQKIWKIKFLKIKKNFFCSLDELPVLPAQ